MDMQSLTNEEIAIAVYFSSRSAGHEACARILALKTAGEGANARTAQSVR